MTRVLVRLTLVVVCFVCFCVFSFPQGVPVSPALSQYGVTSIFVTKTATLTTVTLKGQNDVLIGTLTIQESSPGVIECFWVGADGVNFTIRQLGNGESYELVAADGRVGTVSWNSSTNSWVVDPTAQQLLGQFGKEFVLSAESAGKGMMGPIVHVGIKPPGTGLPTGPDCNPAQSCSDWSFGWSVASCCADSNNDANNCCTNTACWGCCDGGAACSPTCATEGGHLCRCTSAGNACQTKD